MANHELHKLHPRAFQTNRFVYPVLSRRAGGISIGVNLCPNKVCNFNCVYCQVDRTHPGGARFVEIDTLSEELDRMLTLVTSGDLFRTERFRDTPAPLKQLRDIAFSGDGEPTIYRNFDRIVSDCAEIKRRRGLDGVKIVLITNASLLHRKPVQRALRTLDENNGEIWAKLDAGTEEYFQRVNRTRVPFRQIIENITAAAKDRPIVIQTLLMRIEGEPMPRAEREAICDRLGEITAAGGNVRLVQVHTVARPPAESYVSALSNDEVDAAVELIRRRTGLKVSGYYGT